MLEAVSGRDAGEAVVAALRRHGVDTVFGIPGTHTLALHKALADSGIRHIAPRHEQGGGYAADGYARASGGPGVCVVTTGPGIGNLVTAAATAYHDSIPLLIVTPGMPTAVEGLDAGFLHQMKNQSQCMENVVAWSRRVTSAADAIAAIDQAFAGFAESRPRPVHVEIPLEVLESGVTEEAPVFPPEASSSTEPDPEQLQIAVDLLGSAQEPWLLLGGGAKDACPEARALAETLGAVVVTTVNGKGIVPESHAQSIGAALRLDLARDALANADVVIAVGTEVAESDLWVDDFAFGGKLVRVDIDAAQLHKNAPAHATLLGDAATAMAQLVAALGKHEPRNGAGRARTLRAQLAQAIARDGRNYLDFHRLLRAVLDDEAIITGDSSMISYYGTVHQFPVNGPRRFLYPVGFATLGYSLPAAIGAKLALPEQEVVAIDGDGGFLFTATELVTAVELELSLPIVVFSNGGYGEIRAEMLKRGAKPIGVDLGAVDFAGMSEALGGRGVTVSGAEDAVEAVGEALDAPLPTVIDWQAQA